MQIGNAAALGISQRNGTSYLVGTTAEVLRTYFDYLVSARYLFNFCAGLNSGTVRDWLKGVHNITATYTIEMRDIRGGKQILHRTHVNSF